MNKLYVALMALAGGAMLSMGAYAAPIRQVMQVQEAYDAIPHKRQAFDATRADMPQDEAEYLQRFFALVDLAVVERVETLFWFTQKKGADNRNSEEILRQMQSLAVPGKLLKAHKLVVSAIEDQKAYFDAWRQKPQMRFSSNDPRVQSSSSKLRQAYGLYMSLYPNERAYNKAAFYQHLCALDFI
jgi:hypothetical protein